LPPSPSARQDNKKKLKGLNYDNTFVGEGAPVKQECPLYLLGKCKNARRGAKCSSPHNKSPREIPCALDPNKKFQGCINGRSCYYIHMDTANVGSGSGAM
jgi:hypothetical protein